jgi:hypothetical protein
VIVFGKIVIAVHVKTTKSLSILGFLRTSLGKLALNGGLY